MQKDWQKQNVKLKHVETQTKTSHSRRSDPNCLPLCPKWNTRTHGHKSDKSDGVQCSLMFAHYSPNKSNTLAEKNAPNRNIITNANVIWFFDIAKSTGTYSRIPKGLPRDVWFRPVFPPRRKELCACAVCSLLSFAFIFYDGHHFSITCQNGWPWHFCPCSSTFNTANAISSEGKGNGKE